MAARFLVLYETPSDPEAADVSQSAGIAPGQGLLVLGLMWSGWRCCRKSVRATS